MFSKMKNIAVKFFETRGYPISRFAEYTEDQNEDELVIIIIEKFYYGYRTDKKVIYNKQQKEFIIEGPDMFTGTVGILKRFKGETVLG